MSEEVYDFTTMDSKSRVTIPLKIRKLLGLRGGTKFIIIANIPKKEIKIIPLIELQAKVYRLRIVMSDRPGVLAKAASLLAEESVDLLMTESRTIRRGELAEWVIMADLSNCKLDVAELMERVKELEFVRSVEITKLD
ncbi:MAG: ACT domain-containing protein [Candidatus Korarchaeum sp.]|nr:ACT domain-containing protein [Candidatus Korarchaeum sp.]MDW8036241.1 ACT domain-containing protein [Candidatus Korarchaeum sp.]